LLKTSVKNIYLLPEYPDVERKVVKNYREIGKEWSTSSTLISTGGFIDAIMGFYL